MLLAGAVRVSPVAPRVKLKVSRRWFSSKACVTEGRRTNVTWAMSGRCAYIAKVIGIFVSMDRMIGDDFAAGLASMKAVAEK